MGPPLAALILGTSLLSLYRVTLNLPDVPFSVSLRRPDQKEYKDMSGQVKDAVFDIFKDVDGFHNVTVLQFRSVKPFTYITYTSYTYSFSKRTGKGYLKRQTGALKSLSEHFLMSHSGFSFDPCLNAKRAIELNVLCAVVRAGPRFK